MYVYRFNSGECVGLVSLALLQRICACICMYVSKYVCMYVYHFNSSECVGLVRLALLQLVCICVCIYI